MIVTENYEGNPDLVKTYSDAGMLIIQDETGNMYAEAVDPVSTHRTYTESDVPIESEDATPEDYEAALARLGVET